jgi:hypothetical protein
MDVNEGKWSSAMRDVPWMTTTPRSFFAIIAACAALLPVTLSSKAVSQSSGGFGPRTSQVVELFGGIAAGGAVLGIGVFYAFHHSHSLTGCAVSGADGLQLQSQGDQQAFGLVGDVASVKAGDKVRVSGKKKKNNGDAPRQFLVEKLQKDYGPCTVERAAR